MAAAQITLNGAPVGVGLAIAEFYTEGTPTKLERDLPDAATYGVNGTPVVRAPLRSGEIFNFQHWFSYEDAEVVEAMAFLALKAESERTGDYQVFLSDERCKVVDTNPPTYAYVAGSMEITNGGATTHVHRIYRAIFRSEIDPPENHAAEGKELAFTMQVGDPYFAAEQLPPPTITLLNIQTVSEDVDLNDNTLAGEFSV